MSDTKVYLIGGTSGAGKTTLGRTLAIRLGWTSLSIDDLMVAAKAVTTPESHPGLHVMGKKTFKEYYTTSSIDQLASDADAQHKTIWPAVEKVIRNHATFGSPIVMDGWVMRPQWVSDLQLPNVSAFWLVTNRAVLEERERKNTEFIAGSTDPERMFNNFLARSLWFNDFTRREATRLKLPILEQDGTKSAEELCDIILDRS